MKMFSDCSGECCLCGVGDGCIAGHGDDYFCPASKEQIIERLDNNEYPSYRQMMKDHLMCTFGYNYDTRANCHDRDIALAVLKELSRDMYPSCDIFGRKTLVIDRGKFEAIRHKYLD